MPELRDYSYNYTTLTSGTTIALDVPDYVAGDVLVAVLSNDATTAATYTCTGWTQLFSVANSVGLAVMWRIAGSEPASYTFTSSVADTLNGAIISVSDVDQTTPIQTYATANRSANNTAFPTATVNRNNSLLLFAHSFSAVASTPSVIEGPVTQTISKDGSAHADGFGWTIQAASGTSTASVVSSISGTTYNGTLATLVIQPPSGGATVVPGYCAADTSRYIDPIHGTTAFRGNAVFASTNTTTVFGTTLDGKTLAAGTVIARTDYGINTFRSAGGMASSTNRTWKGALATQASSNTDLANENVLIHCKPYLPIEIQTLEPAALQRGFMMGMYSSNSNWKAFHVHGAGTAFGENWAPCVMNSGATAKASAGTLNASSIAGFGVFASGFVAASDVIFAMIWKLGTVTISGGNAAGPVTIPDIYRIVATGKERYSALQQGSSQLLSLQQLQFGDGGTNPLYLNLSYAAIEFPQQRSTTAKTYNYNSIDNVVGTTFYPGASDTLDLRSCVFSSGSKFHWRWHASSSGSATVYTAGMQVIGGGDVVLRSAIPMDQVSFTNCLTITQNACALTNCTLTGSKVISADPGDADNISNSAFVSAGTGHGIEISGTAANMTLTGVTFTGYAASDGSTGNEAIYVNIASGNMTISITGGGSTPSIRTAGATVTVQNAVTVKVTVKDAATGTAIENARVLVEKTSDGTDIMTGLTNASGVVTTTYAYVSDTVVTGTARRATVAYGALYKPGTIAGTITSSGLDVTVLLNSDE